LAIQAGASAVRAVQNGATGLTINLGQLSAPLRFVGSSVDFTLPTTGSIILPAGGVGVANTILTANGAAFATVDGANWAALDGSRNIVSGSSIGGFYTANTANALSGNADMSGGVDTTLAAPASVTSLRFNDNAARTIDATGQSLTTGGILVTSAVGANASTITGGTLRGVATTTGTVALPNQDLVIIQNNTAGDLVIGSQIVDNPDGAAATAATGLTKSGAGRVILTSATNSYTGETHINGGMLRLEDGGALGSGKLFFHGGVLGLEGGTSFTRTLSTAAGANTVQFLGSGGFAAYGGDVTINIAGVTNLNMGGTNGFIPTGSAFILSADDADGTVIVQNPVFLRVANQPQQREIQVHDGSAAVDARLAAGLVGANHDGGLTKTGLGTLEIAGAAGTFRGPTIIEAGTIRLGITNGISADSVLTVRAGTYDLNGFNATASRVVVTLGGGAAGTTSAITTGAGTFTLGTNLDYNGHVANDDGAIISGNLAIGASTKTFTINNSTAASQDLLISAAVTGTAAIIKNGTGTMVLSNTNGYTGDTTINAGTVLVNGSTHANSDFVVNSTGTLGGVGTVNGTATVNTGGTLSPGNSPGILNTGSQTWATDGNYNWQVYDATAAAGTGYDQLSITGSLSISSGFNLNLWSLSAVTPDVSGNALNFNNAVAQSWTIASTTTGITGNEDLIDIFTGANNGTSGFSNDLGGGAFSLDIVGNDLVLNFTPGGGNDPVSVISLVSGAGAGTNLADDTDASENPGSATPGQVRVDGSNGAYVSEIDGLTSNENAGHAVIDAIGNDPLDGDVFVMLWLQDDNASENQTDDRDALRTALAADGGSTYELLDGSDPQWTALQASYPGFDTLVRFFDPAFALSTGAFNWDFAAHTDVVVDQIAVVPEPASFALLALGSGLVLTRSRRTKRV
jgi:autotransporter-associated beta strand protein